MRVFRNILLITILTLMVATGFTQTGLAQDTDPPDKENQTVNGKIFLPSVSKEHTYTISGKVVDDGGKPVQGVLVTTDKGLTDVTDNAGNYAIDGVRVGMNAVSPSGDHVAFQPAVRELTITGNTAGVNFTAVSVTELIINGGFENNQGWQLPATEHTAAYSTVQVHSGSRSLRTGIVSGTNKYSYSTANQTVTIPSGAISARLYLWLYPQTTEGGASQAEAGEAPEPGAFEPLEFAEPAFEPPQAGAKPEFIDAAEASDAQYVMVLDSNGNVLETLIWMKSNNRFWSQHQFDLTRWAGRTVIIHIGTYNDGSGGITAMFADDVSLQVVKDEPPPPSVCENALTNSGFESDSGWQIPATEYTAGYSTAQAYSGFRSMRTGILNSANNKFAYSDAWQNASIPSNAVSAKVRLRYYPISGEVAALGENVLEATPPEMPEVTNIDQLYALDLDEDVQYLLVLDTQGNILQTLIWIKSNAQSWKYVEIDLMKYRGKTIRLQFGTGNDGKNGVTAMYVDEMYVDWCTGDPPPNPSECTNLVKNGGFESNQAWYIPVTEFSAGYSTTFYRSGSRSMRTGIYYQAHNRYSYSDARQAVTLPGSLTSARLSFYLLPNTTASGNDRQYVLILDQYGNWIDTLIWQLKDQGWVYKEFNLISYAGDTIQINFGSYNDGYGGVTSLYVDDVRLDVCP